MKENSHTTRYCLQQVLCEWSMPATAGEPCQGLYNVKNPGTIHRISTTLLYPASGWLARITVDVIKTLVISNSTSWYSEWAQGYGSTAYQQELDAARRGEGMLPSSRLRREQGSSRGPPCPASTRVAHTQRAAHTEGQPLMCSLLPPYRVCRGMSPPALPE